MTETHRQWLRYWWPRIDDIESAKDAAFTGVHVAFFVAGLTGLSALLSIFHLLNWSDPSSLVDAGLFAILGFLMSRMSRVAASLALGLFVLERLYEFYARGLSVGFLAALFIIGLTSGIRGTFAYHRFKKQSAARDIGGLLS
jgi:hypothetical protein